MDPQKVLIVSGIINIVGMIGAYWCGRIQERINWNALIDKGVIPKPKSTQR